MEIDGPSLGLGKRAGLRYLVSWIMDKQIPVNPTEKVCERNRWTQIYV